MFAKKFFPKYENTLSSASYYYTGWSKTDTGRIYIKGYISYPYIPKSPKKDISYHFLDMYILGI
jgi:hypothetical protein